MPQHHVRRANLRLRVVDAIGRGTTGTVRSAWDRGDHWYVAAEVARPAGAFDDGAA